MRPERLKARTARALHGKLAFTRQVFECPLCRASRAPLDEELGLAPYEALTRCVLKKVAWEVAQTSYAQASANLEHQCGLAVSPAECARVALEQGAQLAEAQRQREQRWASPGSPQAPAAPAERQAERPGAGSRCHGGADGSRRGAQNGLVRHRVRAGGSSDQGRRLGAPRGGHTAPRRQRRRF